MGSGVDEGELDGGGAAGGAGRLGGQSVAIAAGGGVCGGGLGLDDGEPDGVVSEPDGGAEDAADPKAGDGIPLAGVLDEDEGGGSPLAGGATPGGGGRDLGSGKEQGQDEKQCSEGEHAAVHWLPPVAFVGRLTGYAWPTSPGGGGG